MSEIKPKKERRFLKTLGLVGEILVEQVLLKLGSSIIKKIGGKKTLPSILFLLASLSLFAQFPNTGNKQRLGFQTSADGLVWRGSLSDTASIQPINNQNAWVILDTVNLKMYSFDFTSNVWNLVGGGGSAFTQPVDSLFFNVNVPTNNVDTAKMRWDSDLATIVLGLNDNVPNELGFKNFWLVKNQTGSNITKGSLVYANGTVGASGRITVDKFIANGSIDAKYLLGITAHDLTDGEDGYVISFGKIRQVNTDTFAAGAILYPSPTVAGVWTDVEPIAPNIDMPIGFCINSSSNNGTIAIRVASGYKLNELHDLAISSPVEKASLYYSGGLWRDTTAALLVSDTASMLLNYALITYIDSIAKNFQDSIDEITNGYFKQEFPNVSKDTLNWIKPVQLPIGGSNLLLVYRNGQMINDDQYTVIDTNKLKINTGSYKLGENYTIVYVKGGGGSGGGGTTFDTSILNLQSRLNLKLNLSDTASMLANYATKAYADTTGRLYARQDFTNVSSSTLTWTQSDTLIPGGVTFIQVYRNGQILLPTQYTIPTSTSVVIASSSFKVNDNYTVIFPRGGGAGSGGGSGSLTSISAGTGILVSPNPITTTGTVSADLSVLMELTDTSLLNLSSRLSTKLNISDTASMLTNYLRTGVAASTYLPLTGGTLTGDLYTKYLNTFAKTTYVPFNAGISEQSIFNVGTTLRGGTVMVFPDSNLVGSSANIFLANSSAQGVESSAMGSGMRNYAKQGGDTRRNSLAFYTSGIGSQNTNRLFIDYDGNVGINDDTPSFKLDVNGTLGVTGATTLSAPLTVNSSAVFNEGSTDSDFRVESDGNVNMVFVDASTDRVGIGTNAPTRTLEVNGTVGISSNVTANSFIKSGGSFTEFLKADGTVDGNDYLTTSSAGSTYYPKTGGTISGAVTLSTTTATPSTLLGKDGSNVIGTVTTVAQTGLMTRGETTATTGSPSATFTVTHGLGFNPTAVLVTSAGIGGGDKIIFEVYTKNDTTFAVQAWNYDGTEASGKTVKIYWLALK